MGALTILAAGADTVLSSAPYVGVGLGLVGGAIGYYLNTRQENRDRARVESLEQSLVLPPDTWEATRAVLSAFDRLEGNPSISPPDLKEVKAAVEENLAIDEMRSRAGTSYKILTDHYANALTQSRAYFLLSYIVGIIGFLVMLGGVAIAYNGSLDSGVLAAVVGAVVDAAAGLVFVQANKAQSNSQANLKQLGETVKDDANRETALHLVSLIDDPDRQNEVLGDLARLAMDSATYRPSARPDAPELPEGRSTSASSDGRLQRPSEGRREREEKR